MIKKNFVSCGLQSKQCGECFTEQIVWQQLYAKFEAIYQFKLHGICIVA